MTLNSAIALIFINGDRFNFSRRNADYLGLADKVYATNLASTQLEKW
jgi:hypothetical protein